MGERLLSARARASAVPVVLFSLSILFTSIGALTAAAQSFSVSTVGGGDLFQPIAQVFTNPRCYNRHGGTDPFTGFNHGGGVQPTDNEVCIACHVDAAQYGYVAASDGSRQRVWRMAPPALHLVGKTNDEICGMLHKFESGAPVANFARVADHVSKSKMVLLAFEGKRAGASSSVDPPPATLADLMQAATEWDHAGPHCLKVDLTPATFDFGEMAAGDTRSMGVTITNRGSPFSVGGIDVLVTDTNCGADCTGTPTTVLQSSTCSKTLASGDACSIQLLLTPGYAATYSVVVNAQVVGDSAAFGSTGYSDALSIPGSMTAIELLTASARSLTFGDVPLRKSVHQTVTVTNVASSNGVAISNAHIVGPLFQDAGDFQIATAAAGCTGAFTLAPKASCTFDIVFAPDDAGLRKRWLVVESKDGRNVTVELNGNGVSQLAVPTLAPSSLDFGQRRVGTTGTPSAVTLTNAGNAALNISSITLGGTLIPFSRTHNCPTSLSAGGSCTISVTYNPGSPGAHSSTLNVYSDAPGSPHTVALTGTGLQPAASLSPSALWFGNLAAGTVSAPQTLTLSNSGNESLSIVGISLPTGFSEADTCAKSLAAGASCSISVTFAAPTDGAYGGLISVTTDAPGSPHQVTVEGKAQGPKLTLSAMTLDFGPVAVNTTSAAKTLTLKNDGLTPLTFNQATFLTFFSSPRNTCSAPLVPGASCTLDIEFHPTTATSYSETAWIVTNAPGSPNEITLKGSGGTPAMTLSPASLGFGTQSVGTSSTAQVLTLSNNGAVPLTITSISSSSLDFAATSACPLAPATLGVGASCNIDVVFGPRGGGLRSGQLVVTSNAQPATQWLGLTGVAPAVNVSSSSLTFGSQTVNTTSASQTLTVTNRGGSWLTISSVTVAGTNASDFGVVSQNCTNTPLAPEQSCTIAVTFRPTVVVARAASLNVTHNDPAMAGSPVVVSLAGTGAAR
jgi:Abnormal spindle-like microcephaly-assoc'd, ASPM-SPD-2-Hydin